jgi:hypothetical protein
LFASDGALMAVAFDGCSPLVSKRLCGRATIQIFDSVGLNPTATPVRIDMGRSWFTAVSWLPRPFALARLPPLRTNSSSSSSSSSNNTNNNSSSSGGSNSSSSGGGAPSAGVSLLHPQLY